MAQSCVLRLSAAAEISCAGPKHYRTCTDDAEMESNGARQAKPNAFPQVAAAMPLPAALDRRAAVIKKQAPKRCRGSRTAIAAQERRDDQGGGCSGCCPATLSSQNPRRARTTRNEQYAQAGPQQRSQEASLFSPSTHAHKATTVEECVRSLPVPGRR
ncbi:hypothetical protein MTO96_021460 [Rhipicephalus appendiculatus]